MALSKITTESLLDGEITLPKFANLGSDGQVLTSTGGSSPPAFEAAAGGAWNMIATAVASADASLTITGLDSTYDTYAIGMSDITPTGDGSAFFLRVGDSGGVDSGGSDYTFNVEEQTAATTTYISTLTSTGSSQITLANAGVGKASGEGMGGMVYLHRPGDGTTHPIISGSYCFVTGSGLLTGGRIMGMRQSVITLDRVSIGVFSSTIASGRLTVWGIAHA